MIDNRGNTEIGRLMHDFSCWDPAEMNYELLKDAARYYKETREGVEYMCKAFEEVRAESRAEGRQEEKLSNLKAMMENTGWTAQKAMDTLNIPKQEQAKYAAML